MRLYLRRVRSETASKIRSPSSPVARRGSAPLLREVLRPLDACFEFHPVEDIPDGHGWDFFVEKLNGQGRMLLQSHAAEAEVFSPYDQTGLIRSQPTGFIPRAPCRSPEPPPTGCTQYPVRPRAAAACRDPCRPCHCRRYSRPDCKPVDPEIPPHRAARRFRGAPDASDQGAGVMPFQRAFAAHPSCKNVDASDANHAAHPHIKVEASVFSKERSHGSAV